jgi:hypothetical protein
VLLGGASGAPLVRSLREVAAWTDSLQTGTEKFPSNARNAFLLCLKNNGMGSAVQAEQLTLQLPVGLNTFEKKVWISSGWENIFSEIKAFDTEAEKRIIDSLLTDIKSVFALEVAASADLDRLKSGLASNDGEQTIILVGASHSRNLKPHLQSLGYNTKLVEMPSWKPNSMAVGAAVADLEKILSAVNFTCLDGAAFYSMTEDSILPISRDQAGTYHVYGDLVVVPLDMFANSVKVCLPLFSLSPNIQKFVLSSLPRYWQEWCCEDDDHVSNLGTANFESTIFTGLDTLRRCIKDILFANGVKTVSTLNFAQLCTTEPGAKTTKDQTVAALAVMWGSDPVHPVEDAYATVAVNLNSLLITPSIQPEVKTPTHPQPQKRPRWLLEEAGNTVTPRGSLNRGRGPWRGRFNRGGRRGGPFRSFRGR